MATDDRFRALVGDIYRAAADPSRWSDALERLSDSCRGVVAGLQYRAGLAGTVTRVRFVRLDPDILQALRTYFSTRNPWVRGTQHLFTPGIVVPTHQILPLSALRRTEFYSDVLTPAGVVHGFGACVLKRGDDVLSFTVVRSGRAGPFEPAELDRVRALLPHLRRAAQANEHLSGLERLHTALGDGLDRLRDGVVIVDRFGHVTYANRTARDIVARRDGLAIAPDGLRAAVYRDRIRLRELIDGAVRSAAGDADSSGGTMFVARPSSRRPFPICIVPLRLAPDGDASNGLATIFISDPDTRMETMEETARGQYGLTPTEWRLTQSLARAGTLAQAADRLGISRETARWHIKRIYRKVGVDHQAALIRRLTGSAPLRMAAR